MLAREKITQLCPPYLVHLGNSARALLTVGIGSDSSFMPWEKTGQGE